MAPCWPDYRPVKGKLAHWGQSVSSDDTASESLSGGGGAKQPSSVWRCRLACFVCCALGVVGLTLGSAALLRQRGSEVLKPTWEVLQISIEYINLPGIKGIAPADTSRCPFEDPCGIASAKGCSACPRTDMWNDGCLCRTNAKGGSAPAGEVIA